MTEPGLAASTDAGPAADADAGTDAGPRTDASPVVDAVPPLGTGLLCLLGLLWLAATMWSAHASIVGNTADAAVVISSAAIALPGVVAATMLAGACVGLAAAARFAQRATPARRALVGAAAGGLCGLVPAVVVLGGYAVTSALAVIAATTLLAGVLGGATAALRAPILAAGVAATLGVFVTGVLLYLFQSPLKALLGAGDTVRSQAAASWWLSLTGAVLSGAVAGLIAYRYLRRREPTASWPAHLLAGAAAGLLLLLAEAITLVGGAGLLDLVSGLSDLDRATIGYLDSARLNQALVVGFAGGIVAMVAVGRSLRRPDDSDDPGDADEADRAPAA